MDLESNNHTLSLKITWWGFFINLALGILKFSVGVWGHSKALVGDALHTFLDLSSDMMTLFGLKMAAKPEDSGHLYGHHKFASLSELLISLLLILFSLGLTYTSIKAFFVPYSLTPHISTLFIAVVSFVGKEVLYWWTSFIAKKVRSRLLVANALHHRTDAFSSLVVLAALFVMIFGGASWVFLDKVIGLFLAFYIAYHGIKLFKEAAQILLDSAPGKAIINDLREHILPTPGAIAYHNFRVRRLGDFLEIDLHLQVEPQLTVDQGHKIAAEVKKNILKTHAEVLDVLIHIEPANYNHIKERGIHDKE